jgi:hypothetical protein
MKKFFTYLFVFFGFLFVLEVGALAYLWYADPFELRPLIAAFTTPAPAATPATEVETTSGSIAPAPVADKNPGLTAEQERALETIGVNPAALPTAITPEMKSCFVGILGAARVAEIEGGATPTPTEVFQTRSCYTQ